MEIARVEQVRLVDSIGAPMSDNTKHLRNELQELLDQSTDETLLAMAAMVLRGEADQVVWPHQTEC